jgi:serine/threonine protein kinase/ABC-type branched-subunit amino acid transport system substrate-binding protein
MIHNIQCDNCKKDNTLEKEFCEHCGHKILNDSVDSLRMRNPRTAPLTASAGRHITVTSPLTTGDIIDNRYRVIEMVGKGGFGAIYKARDERFSTQPLVAVKEMIESQLTPKERERALKDFHREADLLAQLKHPNLPNVSNRFDEGEKAYLVMEFIEGKTLDEVQEEQNGPIDERQVLGWALQLCAVLDYLHGQSQPIIFRDMKPSNVMLTSKGEIKLIDFGIARIFKAAADKDTVLLGSQGYAPLEQYGHGQSDARSDIYALGATLYDLLTNKRPIEATARQMRPSTFSPPCQLNPAISPAVESIILKAMAQKPQNRYQTAAEMYHAIAATGLADTSALERLAVSSPITAPVLRPTNQLRLFVANRGRLALLAVLLIVLLVPPLPLVWPLLHPGSPDAIKTWQAPDGELIGLSDGRYAFDTATARVDASLKAQASNDLAKGDKTGAELLWSQATRSDTSDAEALIYLEDQRVLDSGSPYITLVVGAILTGSMDDISDGRDTLQGAYAAQKEYNNGLKLGGGKLVRLLIANAGSKSTNATAVTEQIVQAAQQDTTVVGFMGWSRSAYSQNAIPIVTSAHLPMVSGTASADMLSGISPYFFRVAPPNKSQAIASAKYAEQQLQASRAALFVDPNDSYSSSLADGFKQQFVADGKQIVDTENYTVGDKVHLPTLLQKALNTNPDLIYFAGYANDLAALLVDLGTSQPDLQVLGGDALYAPRGYPLSAKVGFNRLHFTAFAYFNEWDSLRLQKPQFFSEYPNDFNPTGADHSQNPYGFTRADYIVMLSYDAMSALFQGCQHVLLAHYALTPSNLRSGLTQITGSNAIQGVSGQISFGENGDPTSKAVVVLSVDPDGSVQMNAVLGCFAVGQCA